MGRRTRRRTRSAVLVALVSLVAGALTAGGTQVAVADPERTASQEQRTRATLQVVGVPVGQRANGSKQRMHPAVATVRPPRQGRVVRIQRKVGNGWRTVAQTRQGRVARMDLMVPLMPGNRASQYRAVGLKHRSSGRAVSRPTRVTPPRQTFVDDFNGNRLKPAKWGTRHQPYHGLRTCARPANSRARVGGGVLTLSVKKIKNGRWRNGRNECPNGVWQNAMISTARSSNPFTQRFGTFAARVKFQRARGMHGAFWLQGPTPRGAEIDVIEHYGVGAKPPMTIKVHHTRKNGNVRTATREGILRMLNGRGATQWNVFSVSWTPKRYVFRVNGKVAWRTNRPHVSSAEQEMILSLLTSDYATGRIRDPRSTMKVDWVRAWTN